MIINRIELVNYCQHEHRVIDVSGNLIAVVGKNGVGKSNMLGALQFALTGEQPGKNKADLLHWGAKEGHVVLDFTQDGKPGRIERSVSSNKVTLEYDGVTTSGITNVAKEMETRLHMDKDLVKQSVFVRQTEVDTIISAKTDKRDREVAFQKLLGIDAAKIHKNLTDWMYAAEKPVNYDIQLTEAAQRLGELETRKAELEAEVAAANEKVTAFGTVEDTTAALQQGVAAILNALSARDALTLRQAELDAATAAFDTASSAVVQEDPGVDIVVKTGELSVLKDEERKINDRKAKEADILVATRALDDVNSRPHPTDTEIADAESAVDRTHREMTELRHEVEIRRKALEALVGGESVCPVCGKPLDADMKEHLQAELDGFMPRLNEATARYDEASVRLPRLRTVLSEWNMLATNAKANLAVHQEALAKLPEPLLDADTVTREIAKASEAILKQKAYESAVEGNKAAIESAKLRKSVAEKEVQAATARLQEAEASATTQCGAEAAKDWTKAKDDLTATIRETDVRRNQAQELKLAAARTSAAYDEVCKTFETLKGTVETLKAAQAEQDNKAKALSTLERVRDWFHYQNGPRVLVTQVLGALTDDVNRFLGNFTAPFIVVPDNEQVGFKVEFTDGRTRPEDPPGTDVLSGGERVQLAVAFRLAIYGMFAGKLGLLSLDEPTAYLDDGNVDRFGVLLSKVRELARNMNTQVFMATHERAVIPHMDSIIDLN